MISHQRDIVAYEAGLAVRAGAWGECDPARVREAETGVAGRAFGEHGGQDACPLVEVVMHFGGGLVFVRAQDPADVLGVRRPTVSGQGIQ